MSSSSINRYDIELIESATDLLKECYEPGRLVTSAAVRAESGSIYTGMGLRTPIGGTGVHAEAVAIGKAISEGERDFSTVVAMTYADVPRNGEPRVIAPCGTCRELIASYSTDADIIVLEDNERIKIPVSESLPHPAYPE